jgi:hypothetical protein
MNLRQRPDPCTHSVNADCTDFHFSDPPCSGTRCNIAIPLPFASRFDSRCPGTCLVSPVPSRSHRRWILYLGRRLCVRSESSYSMLCLVRPSAPRSGILEHVTMSRSLFPSPSPCPGMRRHVASLYTSLWDATSCYLPLHHSEMRSDVAVSPHLILGD